MRWLALAALALAAKVRADSLATAVARGDAAAVRSALAAGTKPKPFKLRLGDNLRYS